MGPILFPTNNIDESDVKSILAIYNKIKENFSAEFDFDYSFNFKEFEAFIHYGIKMFGPVICVSTPVKPFYLTFTCVQYKGTPGKYSHPTYSDYQVWGIQYLKNNYGHILIRPETVLDKIHELIVPIELDFEDDKEFSKKFYVVTNDKLKGEMLLTKSFRNYVDNIQSKEFTIEVIDNKLIIGNKKVYDQDSAIAFVNFLNDISKVC
jgi:hypothetical protein